MIINNIELNKEYRVKKINFSEDNIKKFCIFGVVDNEKLMFIKKYANMYIVSVNNNKFAMHVKTVKEIELEQI